MKRIVWHWTGGGPTASAYELTRYHFLIEHDGTVVEGEKPPEANKAPLGPDYVRHAGGFNSDAIGISLCGMHEARESPFDWGPYPLKAAQVPALIELTADLCETYGIRPGPKTVLCHSEVRPRFGRGKYKWDINILPGMDKPTEPKIIGDHLRGRVQEALKVRKEGGGLGALIARIIKAILDAIRSLK